MKDSFEIGNQEANNSNTSGISLNKNVNEHNKIEEVTDIEVVNSLSPLFEVFESDSLTDIPN